MVDYRFSEWERTSEQVCQLLQWGRDLTFSVPTKNQLPNGTWHKIARCIQNNVLLDEDFVAPLGDFGLARFLPSAAHLLSLSQSSSLNIRETIGYVPPEYATGNRFSTYGDVYSYGILLLETFTGRSPTNEIFKDGQDLHNFVKTAIPEQVKDVSDPKLVYSEGGTLINTNKTVECLSSIFQIGIACSVKLLVSLRVSEALSMRSVLTISFSTPFQHQASAGAANKKRINDSTLSK